MSDFWLGFIALPAGALTLALAGFALWAAWVAASGVVRRVFLVRLEPPVDMETGTTQGVWKLHKRAWMAARIMTEKRAVVAHACGVTIAITLDDRRVPAYHLSSASQIIRHAFQDAIKRRRDNHKETS